MKIRLDIPHFKELNQYLRSEKKPTLTSRTFQVRAISSDNIWVKLYQNGKFITEMLKYKADRFEIVDENVYK